MMRRADIIPSLLLAALAGTFFLIRSWHGLWFLAFVDESEHLVGGMMLDRGAILYRTFIDAHGPVVFMLVQAYGAMFGWAHPNWARLIAVLMAGAAALAIFRSASGGSIQARLWAASLFVWLIAAVWILQALSMVNYHEIAGCLMAGAIAMAVWPLWRQEQFSRSRAVGAGVCFSLIICTAYSFAPAAVLVAASALWAAYRQRRARRAAELLAGIGIGLAAVSIWMARFADFVGYFVFHFAANQFGYAKYVSFGWRPFLSGLVPSFEPAALVHGLALVCCALSLILALFLDRMRGRPSSSMAGPIMLGFVGIIVLCARGGTMFQDGSFVITSFATLALSVAALTDRAIRTQAEPVRRWLYAGTPAMFLVLFAATELAMRHALDSPFGLTRAQLVLAPRTALGLSKDPESVRIRASTAPEDRVLAVPYSPYVFLMSGRMPMDRYTTYLPWDADYAKAPWLGVNRDLCEDMQKAPPKLVYFNHWVVWGRWAMEDYAPCFTHRLAADYLQDKDFPNLYVHKPEAAPS